MAVHDLSAEPSRLRPKAASLARLRRAGLAVPDAVVIDLPSGRPTSPSVPDAALSLLRRGAVIVRSASATEDTPTASGAGLGLSIADVRDATGLRDALARVAAHHSEAALGLVSPTAGIAPPDQVIVQTFVRGRWLLVVADHDGHIDAQVHDASADALGSGEAPRYVGALAHWPDAARAAVEAVVLAARVALPESRYGHDLELVVTAQGVVHPVQARPIVAPLWPDAPALLELARQITPDLDLTGRWTLDAEHNPAPLSAAHAWLLRWLTERRPAAGRPTTVAGWLYVQTLPRDLSSGAAAAASSAVATLRHLADELLPAARTRLNRVEVLLRDDDLPAAFDAAMAAFLAMIDAYLGTLVPARVAARAAGLTMAPDEVAPLSLRGREAFADVLPATWDIASPSLADLGLLHAAASDAPPLPQDPATAATLLAEWDDHLFALGLAPIRRVILAAAGRLGLDAEDAFHLDPPRLLRATERTQLRAEISVRRAQAAEASRLRPPSCIEDGRPVAATALRRRQGHAIGPPWRGPLAIRRDLRDLLARPPAPDAVVALPALTAPAAVALHRLGVRAVCSEFGGPLSHAALMARELGLSALLGCRGCTELPDGTPVHVDTQTSRLRTDSGR
jgi:hypothetical protein